MIWIVAAAGFLLAAIAFAIARRTARKLDSLTQSYWEVRYELSRLKAQVARLDPEKDLETRDEPQAGAGAAVAFVPLSALKPARRP
jgi:hypothetical protein